ncbi:MAG: hypothetical protein HOP28_06455 [Gemmatimonadales bacterium]|nr:hypothetical protein [Gemmatimonadales bacterium]
MRRLPLFALAVAIALGAAPAGAQDTVRVGITYRPGVLPALVVLPAPGLDSVRAIVGRDLDFSNRFEIIQLAQSAPAAPRTATPINYAFYRSLGAALALELTAGPGEQVTTRLHDLGAERMHTELIRTVDKGGAGEGRMSVHRLSDDLIRAVTGQPGIAATRIVFQNANDKRIWRVDSDGAGLVPVSPAGVETLSPVWSPDGMRVAYAHLTREGTMPIVLQTMQTGTRTVVPTTAGTRNMTPAFSPDGTGMIFARLGEPGVALYSLNVRDLCCVELLTGGRFAENFSPAYSPDGRRVAFVSTRAGSQQIYVMAADGTDQELLVPYDFGDTGNSNAPDWSPDGATIAFHREVRGAPQIYTFDLAARRQTPRTSTGRNEDPSWAPDGRHLVFISDRTGRRQLWVLDTETGVSRQIMTPASARLPAWSRPIGR